MASQGTATLHSLQVKVRWYATWMLSGGYHMQCEWWAVSSGPVAGAVGQWPRTVCEDSDGPLGLLVLDEPATAMYTFRGQWT